MTNFTNTKFEGHQPFGSEEDFKGFLLYTGMVAKEPCYTKS